MSSLRQFFIVDELQDAALNQDADRLTVVREIVKQIKLSQLNAKQVADDEMILKVLKHYHSDLSRHLALVKHYMDQAKSE